MSSDSKLRLPQLDALRGLAALSVFWYHAFGLLPARPGILKFILSTPFGVCLNGRAAVLLFFVLSGFVLNLKYAEAAEYPQFWKSDFIVRRIFRIYPIFLVTILLTFFIKAMFFDPTQAYSIYPVGFAKEWKVPYSSSDVARLLSLVWPGLKQEINPPVWSLIEEMRISLIFPAIILVINRWPRKFPNMLALIAAYALGFLVPQASTIRYFPHFVLGAICAQHFTSVSGWLRRQVLSVRAFWFLVAFGLYGASTMVPNLPLWSLRSKFLMEQAVGLGAAGIIVFCAALASPVGFMGSKPFRFIGATSYSFYLSHTMFLYGFSFVLLKSTQSYAVTCLLLLGVTYFVSYLLFRFVEMPMNRVGHNWARWALTQRLFRVFVPAGASANLEPASAPQTGKSIPPTTNISVLK